MPVLKNHRRELFANLLVQGFTAVDAYQKAGYKRHDGNASTLANNPGIEARIDEIRADMAASNFPLGTSVIAARAKVTPESLIGMSEAIYQKAMEGGGQLSAANGAVKEMGVLSGVRIERSEIGTPGQFDAISDDELERLLIERLAQLGFALVPAISDGSIALKGDNDD
jgi:hypothetical protein